MYQICDPFSREILARSGEVAPWTTEIACCLLDVAVDAKKEAKEAKDLAEDAMGKAVSLRGCVIVYSIPCAHISNHLLVKLYEDISWLKVCFRGTACSLCRHRLVSYYTGICQALVHSGCLCSSFVQFQLGSG